MLDAQTGALRRVAKSADGGSVLGYGLSSLIGGLTIWSTTGSLGPAIATLFALSGAAGSFCISLIYKRYLGILGASEMRRGTPERQDYDALRRGLTQDNLAARYYRRWLKRTLYWVQRFFRDAGMADRTLFPRIFGLQRPVPLWTSAAFDRCLLIAAIYPVVTIFVIWIVSGHAGPGGKAFGLQDGAHGSQRAAAAIFLIGEFWALIFAARALNRSGSVRKLIAFVVSFAAVALAGAFVGAVAVAFAIVFAGASAPSFAGVRAFSGAVAVAVVFTLFSLALALHLLLSA